jgi:hypothetical protein
MGTGAVVRSGDGAADFRMLAHVLESAGTEVGEATAGDESAEAAGIDAASRLELLGSGGGRQVVFSGGAAVTGKG